MGDSVVRVAAAALGMLVLMVAVMVVVVGVNTSSATIHPHKKVNTTNLLQNLTLLYKDTYLLYGKGRRSERDLPECAPEEACNLAHRRYWLTPITERLCRCPNRSECPLEYTSLNDSLSQHVSNRAQLKFCTPITERKGTCKDGDVALSVHVIERKSLPYESTTAVEGQDTHTILECRCPWPYYWKHHKTVYPSRTKSVSTYTCNKLPKCRRGDECGYIRNDTLESYYTCSCPQQHLCIFHGPQTLKLTSKLHFHGLAYTAKCMLN